MNVLTSLFGVAAVFGGLVMIGCEDDSPTSPSSGAIVTFDVQDERFRASLTGADQVAAAQEAQSGGSARIPLGRIVSGAQVNVGWSWHLLADNCRPSRLAADTNVSTTPSSDGSHVPHLVSCTHQPRALMGEP